ncbi:MAG: hypothetical protein A2Y73_00690 [Chloroflexi bacterium RBG_13_56_8]|nr:MAG: hypothetical protein A2Y73_00690 [Chloroflexi bacterium RBG_13_56_8]
MNQEASRDIPVERSTFKRPSVYLRICLLITALGAYWRFTHLGGDSFWIDELFTLRTIQHGLTAIFQVRDHPPFFYLLAWLSTKILGDGEWALRLPSAVAGVLTLPLIALWGKTINRPRAGLWAALLLANLPFHLRYSQEARHYALLMLLATASYLLLYLALERKRLSWWLAYALAMVLALYTHYSVVNLLAAQIIVIAGWMIVRIRKGSLREAGYPILAAVLLLILYLPWLDNIWQVLAGNTSGASVEGVPPPAPLAAWLGEALTAFGFGNGPLPYLVAGLYLFGLVVWIKRREWETLAIVITASVVPFLLIDAFRVAREVYAKYVIYMLPAYLLAAGVGVESLLKAAKQWAGSRGQWVYAIGSALVALGLIAATWTPLQNEHEYVERDWRGLANYLANVAEDGDVVLSATIDFDYDAFNRGGIALPYYLAKENRDCVILEGSSMRLEDARRLASLNVQVWGVLLDRFDSVPLDDSTMEVRAFPGSLYLVRLRTQEGTTLKRAIQLYEKVLPLAENALPQCPLYQGLATLYAVDGDTYRAEQMLASQRETCPDLTSGYLRYTLPSAIYHNGLETSLRSGDHSEAQRFATEILKLDPKDKEALDLLTVENLLQRFEMGQATVRDEAAPEPVQIRRYTMPHNGDWGDVLQIHPPSSVSYHLQLPQAPTALHFRAAMAPESWDWGGDGSTFIVSVDDGSGKIELFRQHTDNDPPNRDWHSYLISLADYTGKTITLTLATEPGPLGDATGDWAGWETPRIIRQVPEAS